MPAWLGVALAVIFLAVVHHRVRGRDAPGALMAAGMALMAVGMGGIGPHLVHGPWWAAGFAAIALWPVATLVRGPRPERGPLLHTHLPHLVGGAAMIYMCVAGLAFAPPPGADLAGIQLVSEHDHHGRAALAAAGLPGGPDSLAVSLFGLAGWALAGYFLFASVCVLTRRDASDRPLRSRPGVAEAAMGVGTMVMLVSMI